MDASKMIETLVKGRVFKQYTNNFEEFIRLVKDTFPDRKILKLGLAVDRNEIDDDCIALAEYPAISPDKPYCCVEDLRAAKQVEEKRKQAFKKCKIDSSEHIAKIKETGSVTLRLSQIGSAIEYAKSLFPGRPVMYSPEDRMYISNRGSIVVTIDEDNDKCTIIDRNILEDLI